MNTTVRTFAIWKTVGGKTMGQNSAKNSGRVCLAPTGLSMVSLTVKKQNYCVVTIGCTASTPICIRSIEHSCTRVVLTTHNVYVTSTAVRLAIWNSIRDKIFGPKVLKRKSFHMVRPTINKENSFLVAID